MAYYEIGGFLKLRSIRDGKEYVNKSQANFIKRFFLERPDAPRINFQQIKKIDVKPKRKAWVIGSYPEFKEACYHLEFSPRQAEDLCFIKRDTFEFTGADQSIIGSEKDYGGQGGKGFYKKKPASPSSGKLAQHVMELSTENSSPRISDPQVQRFTSGTMQLLVRDINNELWFPATETARLLGYKNPSKAVQDHCRNTLRIVSTETSSGIRNLNFINESDLYRLILRSNLESAQRFQDWVCCEVLPSIRKQGRYSAVENNAITLDALVDAFKRSLESQAKVEENTMRHDESILTPSQKAVCQPFFDRNNAKYQASSVAGYMKRAIKLIFCADQPKNDCKWYHCKQKDFEKLIEFLEKYELSDMDVESLKRYLDTPRGRQDRQMWVRRQGYEVVLK